jgi:hypothetical protein
MNRQANQPQVRAKLATLEKIRVPQCGRAAYRIRQADDFEAITVGRVFGDSLNRFQRPRIVSITDCRNSSG